MKAIRMATALSPEIRLASRAAAPYAPVMASTELDALTQALARLPGLGPRSARRAVLHLMKTRATAMVPLLRSLETVNERLTVCSIRCNVDSTDPCGLCAYPRPTTPILMV